MVHIPVHIALNAPTDQVGCADAPALPLGLAQRIIDAVAGEHPAA